MFSVQLFAFSRCDQEPIHTPGAILPHGAMVVCDPVTLEVLQVAGNTPLFIGAPHETLLGASLERWLDCDQANHLRTAAAAEKPNTLRHLPDPILRVVPGQAADASIHLSDGCLIVEWEPSEELPSHAADPLLAVQQMLHDVEALASVPTFCQAAAYAIRTLTGYDRVMVYRFREDGSGSIIAESREPQLLPYLNLHYPASDIPAQAHALYIRSPLRVVTRVDYDPAPLVPQINPRSGQPLDMSLAVLRNISPLHRAYLRNMGVDASMSISIVCEGKLWGLFICHHGAPRHLSCQLRAICTVFASVFSLQLRARERAEQLDTRLTRQSALQSLIRDIAGEANYVEALAAQHAALLAYIPGTGLCVRGPNARDVDGALGNVRTFGLTPPESMLAELLLWLDPQMESEDVFFTECLSEIWPPAQGCMDTAAGLLAISVSREPRDFIVWFRPEVMRTVDWGGDPFIKSQPDQLGSSLLPRASFKAWQQNIHGCSTPWSDRDTEAAHELRIALLDIVLRHFHANAREQILAQEHRQRLAADLDHWMSNTIGVVQTLVEHASRTAPSANSYLKGLERRIHAMAKSHGLLTQEMGEGMSLQALLWSELDGHLAAGHPIVARGPECVLVPRVALSLAVAIHELAVNAALHGALSTPAGSLDIVWNVNRNGDLRLRWTERNVPDVRLPAQRGIGTTLIERAFAAQPGCRARLRFRLDGVQCDISLPATAIIALESHQHPVEVPIGPAIGDPPVPHKLRRGLKPSVKAPEA